MAKLSGMSRILAIDYGQKKCGIAVSDPLRIIANGLTTVPTTQLFDFLEQYFQEEAVSLLVLGLPHHLDGNPAQLYPEIQELGGRLAKKFPGLDIAFEDETLSSVEAQSAIRESGISKKRRRDKTLVDKIAAVIILQQFMEKQRNQL